MLSHATEKIMGKPDIKFAFADINCRLCLRLKNDSVRHFNKSLSALEKTPSSPGPRKAKCPKTDSDSNEFLMRVLKNTKEFISSASQKEELDEEDLFGQSVGKQLKNLNAYQKSLAKQKIQQVLHEVAWQQGQTN